jgi:hypothetical protein
MSFYVAGGGTKQKTIPARRQAIGRPSGLSHHKALAEGKPLPDFLHFIEYRYGNTPAFRVARMPKFASSKLTQLLFEEWWSAISKPEHKQPALGTLATMWTGAISQMPEVLGRPEGAADLIASLLELGRLGISGPGAAAWLRTIAKAATRTPKPDLVWSGPEVPGFYARDTRRVYEELLGPAERSIWASTYAFFDGPKAFEVLARRMDSMPALGVTLLLNIQRQRGDTTSSVQLVRRFTDHFWKTDWPGSARPNVFYDPRALEPEGPGGVLHAKAVVADDESVFITSANLTEAALDRNIELGVLIRDRALALTVGGYFRSLIDRDLLRPLPLA